MKKILSVILSLLIVLMFYPYNEMALLAQEKGEKVVINDFDIGNQINQVMYSGKWNSDINYPDLFYQGDDHWVSPLDENNTFETTALEITFFGNAIELYGNKEPMAGIQKVYIDNNLLTEVDTYQADKEFGACIFNSRDYITLTEGKHVLRYQASGNKNSNSSAYNMQFDYANVYALEDGSLQYAQFSQTFYDIEANKSVKIQPELFPVNAEAKIIWKISDEKIAKIDDDGMIHAKEVGQCTVSASIGAIGADLSFILNVTQPQIEMVETIVNDDQVGEDMFQFSFIGPWVHEGGYPDRFEGGDEHWITKSQFGQTYPSYSFRFVGTKVELYGHKVPDGPIADVYIDGQKAGKIDYYLPARQEKQLLFESEIMEEQEHIITVKLNGERNQNAGSNYEAAIDYAKFYHSNRDFYPTSLQMDKTEIMLEEGMKFVPSCKVLPTYATVIPEIIWSANNPDIASVNEKTGEIIAIKPGEAIITAKLAGMEIQTSMKVIVKDCKENISALVQDNNLHTYPDNYFEYINQMYDIGTEKNRSWQGSAWRNDEVTSRIDIFTKAIGFENVKLSTSDFINKDGAVIAKDNIKMTYMIAPIAYTNNQRIMDVISNQTIMNLEPQTMYSAWVGISVPENAKPGYYNGTLQIISNDQVLASFDYTLEVIDLVQPAYKSQVELWMYPYSSNRYYSGKTTTEYFGDDVSDLYYVHLDDKYDLGLKSQLELYKKAGGDAITVTVVEDPWNSQTPDPYPSMVKWTKRSSGKFEFDYTDLDKWVKLNMDQGIDGQIKSFSMSCWGNRITYYDEASNQVISESPATGSTRWNELWKTFLQSYVEHMDKMGWFDITYMAMDERPLVEIVPVLDLIESVKNKDGKSMKTSLAVFNYDAESIFDRIDDLSLAYQMGSSKINEIAKRRRETGKITTMYTCGAQNSAMLNQPGESAYSIFYTYKYGTDGFLRWALDSFNDEPLITSQHRILAAGDIYMIYPDVKNSSTMVAQSSPRYEKLIEGLRDVEKLRYLSEQYPDYSEEINKLVASLGQGSMSGEVARMRNEIFKISKEVLYGKVEPSISIVEGDQTMKVNDKKQLTIKADPEEILQNFVEISKINDFDETIKYIGEWRSDEGYPDLFYGGDDHWCSPESAKDMKNYGYEFDFYGDMFSIVGNKESLSGMIEVYIDGQLADIADPYDLSTVRFQKIFTSEKLDLTRHHVKVIGSGTKNTASSQYNMQLDYIETYIHKDPIWTSSDNNIASISNNGELTAHKPGVTTITVMVNNYKASITVTVIDDAVVPVNPSKPDISNTNKVNSNSVSTGDEINISVLLFALLITGVLYLVNKQKKMKKDN